MLTRVDFEPSMAPFCNQTEGPEWFTRAFTPTEDADKSESLVLRTHFLVPRFLSVVIVGTTPGLVSYQPNLVPRKFVFCQFIPKSLFPSSDLLQNITRVRAYDVFRVDIENLWVKRLQLYSVPFQPAFYCTKEFENWWKSYFTAYIDASETKLDELTDALVHLQENATKCKATHIKQIQAF